MDVGNQIEHEKDLYIKLPFMICICSNLSRENDLKTFKNI